MCPHVSCKHFTFLAVDCAICINVLEQPSLIGRTDCKHAFYKVPPVADEVVELLDAMSIQDEDDVPIDNPPTPNNNLSAAATIRKSFFSYLRKIVYLYNVVFLFPVAVAAVLAHFFCPPS
jgi:hypothetical protein